MLGIEELWNESDVVIKITFFILLIMSVTTWSVVLLKLGSFFFLRNIRLEVEQVSQEISSKTIAQSLSENVKNKCFVKLLDFVCSSLKYYEKNKDFLGSSTTLSGWLEMRIQLVLKQIKADLSQNLSLLASIGSTAPFIGLFGTVWGIYLALVKIGETGSANIDQVSGPIGEALTMTALGLAVAIPAVLSFNLFNRTNSKIMFELINISKELEVYMVASSLKSESFSK